MSAFRRNIFFAPVFSTLLLFVFFWGAVDISADSITATIKISVCGDGFVDTNEQCDLTDLDGASCSSRGFTGGSLSCTFTCEFDTSACTSGSSGGSGGGGGGSGGGGGGGGGGGILAPHQTEVAFRGKAYPSSYITLLKDAEVVATTKAGPDANFEIRLSGLSAGTYTFGIWAEDSSGRRSITHTFTTSTKCNHADQWNFSPADHFCG